MCERERERVTAQRRVTVCVPACVREREKGGHSAALCVCVCERERERERVTAQHRCDCVWARVCEREGDTVTQPQLMCKRIRASSLSLSRDSVPLSGLN